jgi:hypothetical protein
MKNPFMSMWLSAASSAANSAAGATRGFWTAEMHRQQTAMTNEMTKQAMRFWSGARLVPTARSTGKARRGKG